MPEQNTRGIMKLRVKVWTGTQSLCQYCGIICVLFVKKKPGIFSKNPPYFSGGVGMENPTLFSVSRTE